MSVLVVDDEESVRFICEIVLGSAGIPVITASSADDALEILDTEAERITLVISDYHMPGTRGDELVEQIVDRYPDLPTLLWSTVENRERGIALKAPMDKECPQRVQTLAS